MKRLEGLQFIAASYVIGRYIDDINDRRVPAYKPGKHWLTSFYLKFGKNLYRPAGHRTMKISNRSCQECQVKSVPKVNKELGIGNSW